MHKGYRNQRQQRLDAVKHLRLRITHTSKIFCQGIRFGRWDAHRTERVFRRWLNVRFKGPF